MTAPRPNAKVPRRILAALMQSVSSGVVPRAGLEHLAVGRKDEISSLVGDLETVADGGASFRVVSGAYGAGKSFLLQLIRGTALDRNFIVMDADLSPERRLTGAHGQGLALYRELTKNCSTKTRPDGGALAAILEKWISGIQADVMQAEQLTPADPGFGKAVETKIAQTINDMEGLVHGFDFAQVIITYWRGHLTQEEASKTAALRWLRGEYATKTEVKGALGGAVRVMIDDDGWYDYVKLLAAFVRAIGYKGLVVILDEAVNLYKIGHTHARQSNYEKLLAILNDCLQGKAQHLAVLVGATPQTVEDMRRGLYSYDAIRTRLQESRFATQAGLRDLSGPVIRLEPLTFEEIFVLLQRLRYLHAQFQGYPEAVTDDQLKGFMEEILHRLGAQQFTTPRDAIRDFVSVLNLLRQNPDRDFDGLVHGTDFQPTTAAPPPSEDADNEETTPGDVSDKFKAFQL